MTTTRNEITGAYGTHLPSRHRPLPSPLADREPDHDCPLCPRLADLRHQQRTAFPDWWNAPAHSFGDPDTWLAILVLAPARQGANRPGPPFPRDRHGPLVHTTLLKVGLSAPPFHHPTQ